MAPTCARPSLEEGNDESLKLLLESHGDITRPDKARQPTGSESCVALGRPVLRSVDSECVGRVIQPREHYLPARADGVLVPEGYLRSTALSWCCGPRRGPLIRACPQGLPRNLGDLDISTKRNGSRTVRTPRRHGRVAPSLHCQATQRGAATGRPTNPGASEAPKDKGLATQRRGRLLGDLRPCRA
jgi:hypothetical protein